MLSTIGTFISARVNNETIVGKWCGCAVWEYLVMLWRVKTYDVKQTCLVQSYDFVP